jgi:hypothetical protein
MDEDKNQFTWIPVAVLLLAAAMLIVVGLSEFTL